MTKIERSALVSYSSQQMFELVNNIADYPLFLPWCSKATVLNQSDKEIEATIEVKWSSISKSFTTRNYLHPYEKMDITLVNGPFRRLEGSWNFTPLSEGCKVELILDFELAGNFVDRLFQPIFNNIANSLVDLFCKRATEVYGK